MIDVSVQATVDMESSGCQMLETAVLCKHCTKVFRANSNLQQHLPTCKSNPTKMGFICENCQKGFDNEQNLQRHMATCVN